MGKPVLEKVLEQHARYCAAPEKSGLDLMVLEADLRYPDSTFVEDTAAISPRGAIMMRPGAESRTGEVEAIRPALQRLFPAMPGIEAPGTVDGGDICEAGEHFFPGISGFDLIRVSEDERYGANCVQVNWRVLVANGFPLLTAVLRDRGFCWICRSSGRWMVG